MKKKITVTMNSSKSKFVGSLSSFVWDKINLTSEYKPQKPQKL